MNYRKDYGIVNMLNIIKTKKRKSMTDNEKWYWLYSAKGGKMTVAKLAERVGDINELYDNIEIIQPRGKREEKAVNALILAKRSEEYRYEFERFSGRGVKFLTRQENTLPSSVLDVSSVQYLYTLGNYECLESPCAAIVGSREAGLCGSEKARELAAELARRGVTVISGLARGIDTCAHEGALMGMGKTAAVLAGGVYPVYPAKNEQLYNQILQSGGVIVSENPPYTDNYPSLFTARNSIISALSQAVAVMEGGEKSGARSTAEAAYKQGRAVFAFCGPEGEHLSDLAKILLGRGGSPVFGADDIMRVLSPKPHKKAQDISEPKHKEKEREEQAEELSKEERTLINVLKERAMTIDEISQKCELDTSQLLSLLFTMELEGKIKRLGAEYAAK